MKILDLVLKKQWFDMIKDGGKREEYREIKPYWTKRLVNNDGTFKDFTHVKFRNGYTDNFIVFRIEKIEVGRGKEEWGGDPDTDVYIIKLAEKQFKKEFEDVFKHVINDRLKEYYDGETIDLNVMTKLMEEELRVLFKDNKLCFGSNKKFDNFILLPENEHTKEVLKYVT